MKTGRLTAAPEHIWPLLRRYLYASREVFLRELISNGVDALSRLHRIALLEPGLPADQIDGRIDVSVDRGMRTVRISDNGVGMSEGEIDTYINQMAVSGTADFLQRFQCPGGLIGCFGVGFYSAFLVADWVRIETRSYRNGERPCWWLSRGDAHYEMDFIDPGEAPSRGTRVTVHIAPEYDEFLDGDRVLAVVRKYCDFVPYPIYVNGQLANSIHALWHEPRANLPAKAYEDLYARLYEGANRPHLWVHLEAEFGASVSRDADLPAVTLHAIIYLPHRPEEGGGIRLFSQRVFVDDDFHEAVPEYMGFLRGVIDVEGARLNLSRERIQEDATVERIRSFVARKLAQQLARMAQERREDFTNLWSTYEQAFKIAALQNSQWLKELFPHFLFPGSQRPYTSVGDYLERNQARQGNIVYYLTDLKRQSAYLAEFRQRNQELLDFSAKFDLLLLEKVRQELPALADFRRVDTDVPQPGRPGEAVSAPPDADQAAFLSLFRRIAGELPVSMVEAPAIEFPLFVRRQETDARRADMADILHQFDGVSDLPSHGFRSAEGGQWSLVVNRSHVLTQQLLTLHRDNPKSEFLWRTLELLYRQAIVRFGLADEKQLAAFCATMEDFVGWICTHRSSLGSAMKPVL